MSLRSVYGRIAGIARSIYDRILADDEGESVGDGYLSHKAEWHSALWGLSVGFVSGVTGQWAILLAGVGWLFTRAADSDVPDYIPYPKQFIKESGYVLGHALAGSILGVVVNTITFSFILSLLI